MPSASQRLLPSSGVNTDVGDIYLPASMARFLKNLSYVMTDTSEADPSGKGGAGYFKPLEANQVYDVHFVLPDKPEDNFNVGSFQCKDENYTLTLNYNRNGNHGLYKINGETETVEKVYENSCLNLSLRPQNFLHLGGGWLEVFHFTDPNTDSARKRSFFIFTTGENDLRFICIEDSIATNGFDETLFPYFVNPHPECLLINAGVPTPLDCLVVTEVANTDASLTNNLRFKTWQFRVKSIDVYGRMSEHGIISDLYIPGTNDCIGSSELLARCLNLTFDAGNALIDKFQIEFRNCNDEQWYLDTTLFLFNGSNLGDWWLRPRNSNINYNSTDHTVTYIFCRDKECNPIATEETNRTENPLPRITQSVAKIGKVIGVANNKHKFNPFGSEIMDEISVEVIPPDSSNSNARNIEIYVPLWNPFTKAQQPVYKDDQGRYVWGGFFSTEDRYVATVHDNYYQYFGDDNRTGFIGYLAGTGAPPNSVVSELWYVDASNNFVQIKLPDDLGVIHTFPWQKNYFLKFTFNNVAPAIYKFRVAASTASLTNDNFQATSANVWGSFAWANKSVDFFTQVDINKELTVDVCAGNYSSLNDTKVLSIFDLTVPSIASNRQPQAFTGYVSEKLTGSTYEIPVELLNVRVSNTSNKVILVSPTTDHNGFYFGTAFYPLAVNIDPHFFVDIYGNCGCNNYVRFINYRLNNDHSLDNRQWALQGSLNCPNYNDSPCNRILIKGKVLECGSGIPVPGVGVVLSRGQYAITGADGTFTIIAHDDNYKNTTRVDDLIFVPTICAFKGCDTDCIPAVQIVINKCSDCIAREIHVSDMRVRFTILRGLLSGGKYGVSIWGDDWLGRHGFAQVKDAMYIQIPTLTQTKTLAPSTLRLIIPSSVRFPLWITKLSVGITKELIMGGTYLSWIVDRVQFIDNTGNENNISPTQIKIYYASLIEYNKQNNFNTTTQWNFIVQSEPAQLNYTSDFVEFYINGDGVFFPTLTRALIKYDQTGQYFLINYDTALKDLKSGAVIRLGRPQQCATQDLFFELCHTIDVIDGVAQESVIDLNAFDTYYKYRQIPIPIPTDDPDVTENVPRTFGLPFEHHSPSDFWGDHCQNIGRPNVRNPYECEIILPNEIMRSGPLLIGGQLNYLNYFDEELAKNFNSWNFGGIVSIIPGIGALRIICQFATYVVGFDDNLLRQTEQGFAAASAEGTFGQPERAFTQYNFGCLLFDKNTIAEKEGRLQFLDTRECVLIQMIESIMSPVSRDVVDSYLQAKIKSVNQWNVDNPDNLRYFTGVINPAAKEYWLTDFKLNSGEYVNNERAMVIAKNDTLVFDYFNKGQDGKAIFRGWVACTAENYTFLEGQKSDLQLFSFKNGIPYKHYSQDENKTYSRFFGIDTELVIRPVAVSDGFVKKKFKNAQGYCKQLYWSDQILSDSGQVTRLLKSRWKQGNFFWSAGILCDLNTPPDTNAPKQTGVNKLFDGNNMWGVICDVRFVCVAPESNKYSELTGFIIEFWDFEKSGGANP